MLRLILSSSSRRSSVGRFRNQILGPRSLDSYSTREFADATVLNASRNPRKPEEPPEPESPWPKILIGGMAVGIASLAAYQVSMR
ncbi:hypothetical protein MLD38_019510 [Melastoma candidum]|uniref:Uncharacterized protein n=1 Tax=Melastoma candidum TaxID=119954 RepID=A0ACB9QXF2_9MYRT|nr:hypothetical protein MLD38_019510 [Melastoma candidum]